MHFLFYADGRFGLQYLNGQKYLSNWGNLYDLDFENVNLLILLDCENGSSYTIQDIRKITDFVSNGGGVVILGNQFRQAQNELAKCFGASFATESTNQLLTVDCGLSEDVISQGNVTHINFENPEYWTPIVKTMDGNAVLAISKYGKGSVVVGNRSLAGSNPDGSDSINYKIWKPLLHLVSSGKSINEKASFAVKEWDDLGNTVSKFGLTVNYSDYLLPYADAMINLTVRCMPVIEKRMGVSLSKGMGSTIMLLASGGEGFSAGNVIALAVWWGGFPEREEPMIEFITHESVHSWVLPYAEIWNEPIATYVGDLVMADMGYEEESAKLITACIERARLIDPTFSLYDINGKSVKDGVPELPSDKVNDLHWGKSFWIFEQLRKENPDFLADYFRAKREYAIEGEIQNYDENNTVAVLSIAMKRDLFPWFRSIGFDVDRNAAEIKFD